MMKMASGDGIPLRKDAGIGSRLVFGGYRGLWRRNSRSIVFPDVFRVYGYIYRQKKSVRGATRGPRGWGTCLPPWAHPPALWPPCFFLDVHSKSPGLLPFQNNSPKGFIPFGLRLIFLFFETLKEAIKQQYGLGLRLVG